MAVPVEVLDGVDAVRKRPEMYAGDTATRSGPHGMLRMILDGALNEHLAGRRTRVDVAMHADGSLSVSDDGAGISLELDEHGTPWLEQVLTKLTHTPAAPAHPLAHLRSHFDFLFVVSALSSSFPVEVRRDGQRWRVELEAGRITKKLAAVGPADTTGTVVRFTPDASLFAMPGFDADIVARRVRELPALLPELTTSFSCERQEYTSGQGVVPLLAKGVFLGRQIGRASGEARDGATSAQVAFEWNSQILAPSIVAHCNLKVVPEGSHIAGFRAGLADALEREDSADVYEKLSEGLNAVLSVLVCHPDLGPTASKLVSKEASAVVREATARAFKSALESNADLQKHIAERLR